MSLLRRIAVLGAVLLLAACGGLRSAQPLPLLYRPGVPQLPAGAPLAADLLLARPAAAPELQRLQIVSRWSGQRLDFYANARWSGPLPELVQATLLEALQGSGRLRSVQAEPARFRATHLLEVELRQFEADYSGGGLPVARVTLAATLGRQADRRPLDSWTAGGARPAAANRQAEVVAALDAAYREAAAALAGRCLAALERDLAAPPPP